MKHKATKIITIAGNEYEYRGHLIAICEYEIDRPKLGKYKVELYDYQGEIVEIEYFDTIKESKVFIDWIVDELHKNTH